MPVDVPIIHGQNLQRPIISMLSGVKDSPSIMKWTRILGSEKAPYRGITVGYMDAGDLIVAFVLKTGQAAERRIDRGRGIASLREHADRLIRRIAVVEPDVEQERRIQRVPLGMQRIAGIFHKYDLIRGHEGDVVEPGMLDIALVQHRQLAFVAGWLLQRQLHDRSEASVIPPASVNALVSPVSSKKNSWNWVPGRNCPFSGRLNGVAPAALAAALASNAVVP